MLSVYGLFIFGQEIKGRSPEYYFDITKDPPKPPYLEMDETSIVFSDANSNSAIDANETSTLEISLKNTGMGDGIGLKLKVQETTGSPGFTFSKIKSLDNLEVGESQSIRIPIEANMGTLNGRAVFQISVEEPNGFGSDPIFVELATRAFAAPSLIIADYTLQSSEGNRILKKRAFDVQILVQNIGQGVGEQIKISLTLPANMFCLSSNLTADIDAIKSGESQTITYNLITTNEFSAQTIPLNFVLSERYGKYGQSKEITLEINQEFATRELSIKPVEDVSSTTTINIATLSSAVDKTIPVSNKKYPFRFALIIGNENYTDHQVGLNSEMNVAFARNDASVFRQYAEKTLGIEDKNIFFTTDATSGKMNQEINKVEAILKRVGKSAELVFYYAGHGFPDESTQSSYLIPVDVSASNITSGVKLNDLYNRLAETGASKITMFLDACFSGGGRNSGLLAARSVKVRPNKDFIYGNLVVFTASSGEQSSLPYNTEKHGMFTFYLLKKLQETSGNVSYYDLAEYIKNEVSIQSIRINSKEQDPNVLVGADIENVWGSWMVNP